MVSLGSKPKIAFSIFVFCILIPSYKTEKSDEKEAKPAGNEAWKKKNIRDYSEADLERLFDQWEDNDEDELEEDELPEWKKEPPKIDMSQIDPSNPEQTLKMSKKGRTLMLFATVSGDPLERETEKITSLWHSSLFNAHIETQRYVVGSNRVIFMLTDGSKAWDVKDFLVKQERCEEVTIEGKSYPGLAATQKNKEDKKIKASADKKKDNNKIHKQKEENINKKTKTKSSANIEDNRTSRKKEEL